MGLDHNTRQIFETRQKVPRRPRPRASRPGWCGWRDTATGRTSRRGSSCWQGTASASLPPARRSQRWAAAAFGDGEFCLFQTFYPSLDNHFQTILPIFYPGPPSSPSSLIAHACMHDWMYCYTCIHTIHRSSHLCFLLPLSTLPSPGTQQLQQRQPRRWSWRGRGSELLSRRDSNWLLCRWPRPFLVCSGRSQPAPVGPVRCNS